MTMSDVHRLPQLDGTVFLSEGGLETDLIFRHGIDLPDFASFPLLDTKEGTAILREYYESFVEVARRETAPGSCSRHRPGARAPTGVSDSATPPPGSTASIGWPCRSSDRSAPSIPTCRSSSAGTSAPGATATRSAM